MPLATIYYQTMGFFLINNVFKAQTIILGTFSNDIYENLPLADFLQLKRKSPKC